ncbi:alpha/beta hydrolase [Microcella daejeonensis]|uniref:alpha/beta fold hydrolase n=1 Tax=Microcella daejeonensis TaxID=2994971 RepID=UPI00226EDA5B|nr:alpha/beta hydrolase [Microcella daejeonensis]WAB83845.1 alpha/beta hydrolase [Microcella daejeonensis]
MITSLSGGRVLAEKSGSTPPAVVALHGWGRDGGDFATILSGLDAVSIHLPGFGPAPAPETVWGTEQYAELVAEAIAAYAPVVVVGHSFGGRVAVRLAARRPELVSGLVLTGAPLVRLAPTVKPPFSYRLARWANARGLLSDARMDDLRNQRGSADYRAAQGVMRGVLVAAVNEDYDDDLRALTCPVSMVWGEHDTAAPTEAGRIAAERCGARFRVVPGSEHLLTGDLELSVREELMTMLRERNAPA